MSPLFPCSPFDSAARGSVQPVVELGHLQRHDHGDDVFRALRACPATQQPPQLGSSLRTACAAAALRPPVTRPRMPTLFPCVPFDSAASVGVQPATELRHFQSHDHGEDVYRAHRACPASNLPAHCLCRRRPTTPRSPGPVCRPSSHAPLSTRQQASAFNQPLNFVDISSVTSMKDMFYQPSWARSARAPPSSLHSWVLPAHCLRRRGPTPSRDPAPHTTLSVTPPFRLGSIHTFYPAQTRSSCVALGRAIPSLIIVTVRLGAVWAHALPRPRRRHRRRRPRRRCRWPRHRRACRRRPTSSRARAP